MNDKNQEKKIERKEDKEHDASTEKMCEESRQNNEKDLTRDSRVTSQQTVNKQFDQNNPFTIEDVKAKQISDRVQQAQEYLALSRNLSQADSDGDGTLSKDELRVFSNDANADMNARRGAQSVLDRYDRVAALDRDTHYWESANVSASDLGKLSTERMIEAGQIRGLQAFDKDGDGTATRDELYDAANNSQTEEDRKIAYVLYGRDDLSHNVADENWGSGNDRGITQRDLDFEVKTFKSEASYDNLECTEALNSFPSLKNSGMRPEDLKSIIDNENRKRGVDDWFQDNVGQPWGDPTVGEAQIKKSTIAQLKKDYPQVAELDEYDPKNAPMFAAAYLANQRERLIAGEYGSGEAVFRSQGKNGLADRYRDMQQDWNSNDPERMRRALIQSYNPGSPNADHYDVIVSQSNSRPVIAAA